MKEPIVSEIMNSPRAPMILEELQQAWTAEQAHRQHFYDEMTEAEKTEFIKGEVIVHSPARKHHVDITGRLVQALQTYAYKHQLGYVGFEKILIRLTRNDYEPDVCFFKQEKVADFADDQMFFPAPDLVVEVLSKSTAGRNRGVKFEDYQLHGVEEYWMVDAEQKVIEQYVLSHGKYELIKKAGDGSLRSTTVQGLVFPIEAAFHHDQLMQFVASLLA